jgi:hypothetical protein
MKTTLHYAIKNQLNQIYKKASMKACKMLSFAEADSKLC